MIQNPPKENERHRRVSKITADVLINHFTKIQPELEFEEHFAGWTQRASLLLAPQYQIIHGIVDSPPERNISDQQYDIAYILWKALNTVVSAIELARKGYVTEPLILLRHVLECVCAALDVHQDAAKIQEICSHKYESTKAIGRAKRIVPVIGPFYGFLSNTMAHVGIMATAPQWVAQHKQGPVRGLLVGGGFDETRLWQFELVLHQIELGIDVFSTVVENIFFEELSDHMYWKKDNKQLQYAPSKAVILRAAQVTQRLQKQLGSLNAENPPKSPTPP